MTKLRPLHRIRCPSFANPIKCKACNSNRRIVHHSIKYLRAQHGSWKTDNKTDKSRGFEWPILGDAEMHEDLNTSSVDDETLDKEVTCKDGNVLATICVRVFDLQAKEMHEKL